MLPSYKSISLKSGASLAVLSLLICGSASATGLPSNGHFVSGQGQIGKAGQSLAVKQSSTTGIINWSSFSVGAKDSVSFNNGSGATLNMVSGGNLSRIAGTLHATGSLYLMNSAGVIVSGTGHVVTGGNFVATSGTISNGSLGENNLRFDHMHAAIVNRGSIVARGAASLVGTSAINSGAITASQVALHATTGDALAGGTITATGSAYKAARIWVISQTGATRVAGDLVAHKASGAGGSIETSGSKVSIAGHIDAGNGGTWLIDPVNLTVDSTAATTIDDSLSGGTDVTLQTTASGASGPGNQSSGPGNIIIDSALTWNTTATLTLDAYHSVQFRAPVDVTAKGNITLLSDDGGTGGSITFPSAVTFDNVQSQLMINGESYKLVDNIASVAAFVERHHNANVALANDYDASADGTYTSSPVEGLDGAFEGLGHSISNLSINEVGDVSVGAEGLINDIGTGGSVSDLSLRNINMTADIIDDVGGISGIDDGVISNVFVSGRITVNSDGTLAGGVAGSAEDHSSVDNATSQVFIKYEGSTPLAGGLVGENQGTISNSVAHSRIACDNAGNAGGDCGGLVGWNSGTISGSRATGDVLANDGSGEHEGDNVGGLAGLNSGAISHSSASGRVEETATDDHNQSVGGLVGLNEEGAIQSSFATGNVSGDFGDYGGLAGDSIGDIETSYATGDVRGRGASTEGGLVAMSEGIISNSYATGNVVDNIGTVHEGALVGGLAGENNGDITNSHATGNVRVGTLTTFSDIGGLVGWNSGGFIENSYAIGNVSDTQGSWGNVIGGLVGKDQAGMSGQIVQSYATGKVTAHLKDKAGGLVGTATKKTTLSQDYASGQVSGGHNSWVGGFIGAALGGTISQSYSLGSVQAEGHSKAGGFAGKMDFTAISQSYATGNVKAGSGSDVGGFIGLLESSLRKLAASITDSYAIGNALGRQNSSVGGFAGYSKAGKSAPIITTSYSTGVAEGGASATVGGLIGTVVKTVDLTSDYWNTDTSGLNSATGSGGVSGATGLTTAQFQSGLPTGFDSSVWAENPTINGGLPYLIALASSY